MSDIDERLARIEQTHDQQRQRWIAAAAKNTGFHDPRDALLLVDPATVVTPPDADRAVAALAQERPYLAVERIT
jgi:hypothetical protein